MSDPTFADWKAQPPDRPTAACARGNHDGCSGHVVWRLAEWPCPCSCHAEMNREAHE